MSTLIEEVKRQAILLLPRVKRSLAGARQHDQGMDEAHDGAGAARQSAPSVNRHRDGDRNRRLWHAKHGSRLAIVAQGEHTNQQAAAELWWLWTKQYLPAKRLDVQQRRGTASHRGAEPQPNIDEQPKAVASPDAIEKEDLEP